MERGKEGVELGTTQAFLGLEEQVEVHRYRPRLCQPRSLHRCWSWCRKLRLQEGVASAFGGRQLGTIALSWIVPLFTIGMTPLSGLMLDEHWPSNWPPPWLVWPVLFAPGLAALIYAWRIWFGQLQARRPATFEDPPG